MDRKEIRCVRESDGIWRFFFSFRGVVGVGWQGYPIGYFTENVQGGVKKRSKRGMSTTPVGRG